MSSTLAASDQRTDTRDGSGPWPTPWAVLLGIFAVSVLALWPTWLSLHGFWLESSRYSHGYLIVAIIAYMLYCLRPRFAAAPASPSLVGLAGLAGLLSVWTIANLGSIQAIHQILLPAILWLAALSVLGWRLAGVLLLPIGYLYLAVPIWESGNFVLQNLTVHAVEFALAVVGIPAFISGNFVSLPAGTFEIASGCSGLHYLIISFAIALLYAWLYVKRVRTSALLVGLVVFIALLTNWVRVFLVIVAGHVTDMQHYLVTEDHYTFGWILYGIAMLPLLWVSRRMDWQAPEETTGNLTKAPARRASAPALGMFACVTALLLASSAIIYAKMPAIDDLAADVQLPGERDGWVRGGALTDWQPVYSGNSAEVQANYARGEQQVSVYANVYLAQSQGKELIGYENRIQGPEDSWRPVELGLEQLTFGQDGSMPFRKLHLVARNGAQRVVYFRYNVGGRFFTSDLHAKLYYGLAVFAGRPEAGVEIVSTRCQDDCSTARDIVQDWLNSYATGHQLVVGANNE
ncbi:MAG: EpsI family protein [Woeseia sp.]